MISDESLRSAQYSAAIEAGRAARERCRPSVLYAPRLSADGDMWMALLGANLAEGVAGFGPTPDDAMRAFDRAFETQAPPVVERVTFRWYRGW